MKGHSKFLLFALLLSLFCTSFVSAYSLSTNYSYVNLGTINTTSSASLLNFTYPVNYSTGFYNSIIWCRNPDVPSSAVNGSYLFYENSPTDYRSFNASDNQEYSCEVAKGSALNRTTILGSAWDDDYLSVLHFESFMDSTGISNALRGSNTFLNESGKIGSAVNLSGDVNGIVTLNDLVFSNHTTIMGWVNLRAFADPSILMANSNSNNWEVGIQINSTGGVTALGYNQGAFPVKSKTAITLNTWYFIAYRIDVQNMTIYINGEPSNSITNPETIMPNFARNVTLGNDIANNMFYDGFIDEFVIINRTLSDEEIRATYETQQYNYAPIVSKTTLNAIPIMTGIAIDPVTAYTTSTLNCSATYTDFNSDLGSVTLKFNNGTFTYSNTLTGIADGELVSLALVYDVTKGETWNCSINASDGTDESALVSTTRDVSNSVPTATSNAISPATAYPNSTIICSGTASDIDVADVLTKNYRFRNSTTQLQAYSTTSNFTCTLALCPLTATIYCDFKANDGSADSNVVTNSVNLSTIPPPYENPFYIRCRPNDNLCLILQGTGAGFGIFIGFLAIALPILLIVIAIAGAIILILGALGKLKLT
jgi:hypothetical protein